MAAMEMPDVASLVATFCLQTEAGINMLRKDYKLLNRRHNASKREMEAIAKKT
jgi:hypothetical protein